jgi:signal transduction histidine kinase
LASRLDDVSETGAPLKTIAALSVLKLADWSVVEMKGADGKLEQLAAAHVDLEKTTLLRGLHDWLSKDDSLLQLPAVLAGERAKLFGEITEEQINAEVHDPELLMCLREVGLRSAIVVPVTTRAGTIGVIVLAAGPSRRRYDESDLTQAVELARRAALATDNSELFTQKTRAVELRDNFLATAGHELRTPLASLSLHLDALMMEAKALSQKEPGLSRFQNSLNRAMFHSERLGGLIHQLLDVSKLRGGTQLDLAQEVVDLGKLVQEVTDRFSDEATRASCSLEARVPEQPVVGYWDPLRLDQVATNLIGNAIKYGAGQPVKVEVSSTADKAVLTVRDRGIGIKQEDQQRIFGKFERAVSGRNYGGLGLGLWITRQALEAMGGTIRVESTPGAETTFTVEVPLRDPPSGP